MIAPTRTFHAAATIAAIFTAAGFIGVAIRAAIAHPDTLTITAACFLCVMVGVFCAWVTS